MPDNIATQLRSLAVENRDKAAFFELAADLHEVGYQSDIEAAKLVLAPRITELEGNVRSLTEILNLKVEEHAGIIAAKDLELATANARIAELETQLATANARIAELETQLVVKEPVPAEDVNVVDPVVDGANGVG